MVELVRSNDLVHLSWAEAMLKGAGIECVIVDVHISSVEGSIGVLPRRLLVATDDLDEARRVLEGAASAELDDQPE